MNTTIVIPENVYIGYIIGFGGRTIRSIEDATNTQIRWPHKWNPDDRKFTISGVGSRAAMDVDNAVDEILQLVNGRLAAKELTPFEKDQLILSLAQDNAPEPQVAPVVQQKPSQTKEPAMSSVPSELLRDVLLPLDRRTLDDVQFTNRRFLRLILEHMSDVCLRQVYYAGVGGLIKHKGNTNAEVYSVIHVDGRPEVLHIAKLHEDAASLCLQLIQALRSSRVEILSVSSFALKSELAAIVLQIPIVVHELQFNALSCAELTPTQFQEVILHFAPTFLFVNGGRYRACQLSDGFLRTVSKTCSRADIAPGAPVDGDSFYVTDDAVVDFCAQQDVGVGIEGDSLSDWEPYEELILNHGTFTKDLFKRLVEASSASMRTQMLRIGVGPLPRMEDEDLQDFAEHLSYRKRDNYGYRRVYDFPDEPNGMHLQIKLSSSDPGSSEEWLMLVRAHRPNSFFYDTHE